MKKYFSIRKTNSGNWALCYWGTEIATIQLEGGVMNYDLWKWMPMFVNHELTEVIRATQQLNLDAVTFELDNRKGLIAPEGWCEASV